MSRVLAGRVIAASGALSVVADRPSCPKVQPGTGGSWINTAAVTWNAKAKLHVPGANSQPDASRSFTVSGANRILKTNDLPAGATTGNFPISPGDPAYRYDTNPNHVVAQSFDWKGPADPRQGQFSGLPRPGPDRGLDRRGGLLRCP